jgi:hypothetical protein
METTISKEISVTIVVENYKGIKHMKIASQMGISAKFGKLFKFDIWVEDIPCKRTLITQTSEK